MIETSWKLFQNQNSAHFTTKTFKYGTSQCLEGCTQLQKWAIYKKWQLFWKTKLHAGLAPMQKWFKGWEFFYEDFNIWLTYVQKRILLSIFGEKLWIFKKRFYWRAHRAPVLKHSLRGYFNPWECIFFSFYTKRSVLGSKIGGFVVILMSISSRKVIVHLLCLSKQAPR